MADGGPGDKGPGFVRRQVELTVRCVIDVPANLDEDAVKFLVEEHHCNSDLIMSLAEQIAYDDEQGACNVCFLSQARLVPVKDEIQSAWLSSLPQPTAAFHPGDEDDVEEDEDVPDEEGDEIRAEENLNQEGLKAGGDEEEEAEEESDVEDEEDEDGDVESDDEESDEDETPEPLK